MTLNYIIDSQGNQSAVVVPIKEWTKFVEHYDKLKNKLNILTGIKKAIDEVNQIKAGGKKGKSLREFLDENKHHNY